MPSKHPRPPDDEEVRVDDSERSYWDGLAPNYDRSMRLLGRPMPRMVELAAEAVRGSERVLEVAAGTGLVTLALARAAREVVATDYAPAMVEALERRVRAAGLANVRCEAADVYALPYETGSFDAVVAANVLHLVPDLEAALEAMRRVTKPGGLLVVPTFAHAETRLSRFVSRVIGLTGFPGHRRFDTASLRAALEKAGATITRSETIPGLLPIAYVEARWGAEKPLR